VIVDYLEAKYKKKKLIPAAAKAMGQARLIAAIAAEYVQPAGLKFFRMKRANQNNPADIDAAKAELAKGLDVLDKVLTGKKFAAGPSPTIADCFVVPAMFFAVHAAALFGVSDAIGSRAKVRAYWNRVQADKTAAKILQGMSERMKQLMAA
jgi:glutathione S-transferase